MADPIADGYRLDGKWKTYDKFACNHCPFDCLNEQDMIVHVTARHGTAHVKNLPTLFDSRGNLIVSDD
jgi:hypothetical protein